MEKVKLTKRQANAIKSLPSHTSCGRKSLVESHFKQTFKNDWACINGLSTDDFIKCLYIGYEIKQTEQEIMQEIWDSPLRYKSLFYYHQGIIDALSMVGRKDLIPQDKS